MKEIDKEYFVKYIKTEHDFQVERMAKLGINTTGQCFEQMVTSLICLAEQRYSEEDVINAYNDAYHKGYNVGQKDAETHPLALTIADDIHKDRKAWFEQFRK